MMPVMAVMTGIQASGKSTFCREYLPAYTRINLDALHTRNKEKIAMDEAFLAGHDMVIDNTNPTVEVLLAVEERGEDGTGRDKRAGRTVCELQK